MMRRTFVVLALLLILVLAAAAWPIWGLYQLARAVEARNVAEVANRVDFVRVRQSLAAQLMHTYLRVSGREVSSVTQQLAIGTAVSIADPVVSQIVSPQALTDLLHTGWPTEVLGASAPGRRGIDRLDLTNAWSVFFHADYGIGRFATIVPPDASPANQFRLRLALRGGTWKLVEVGLSERLRTELAQKIVSHVERKP